MPVYAEYCTAMEVVTNMFVDTRFGTIMIKRDKEEYEKIVNFIRPISSYLEDS